MEAAGIHARLSKCPREGRWKRLLPLVVAAAAILGLLVIAQIGGAYLPSFASWVADHGRVAGDIASAAGGGAVGRGTAYYVVLVLGLVATAGVTIMITWIARQALIKETNDDTFAHA